MADPLTMGLMAVSTLISAVGTIAGGEAAKSEADNEAMQLEAQAKAETAQGSRKAAEDYRQMRLKLSAARAAGAASGAGRGKWLEGEIEEEGQYEALTSIWAAGERASGRRAQADAARQRGRAARRAGWISAAGTVAGGAAGVYGAHTRAGGDTFFSKYGSTRADNRAGVYA